MNKTFKVIFSKTRGALVAVNEAAKTTSRASVKTAVAGVCAALLSVPAMARGLPTTVRTVIVLSTDRRSRVTVQS